MLINVGLVVAFTSIFFAFLAMIAYGARLEQKYKQLLEEKEKQK